MGPSGHFYSHMDLVWSLLIVGTSFVPWVELSVERRFYPIFVTGVRLPDIHEYFVGLRVVNGPPGIRASHILSITISIVAAQSTANQTKENSTVESHVRLPENKGNYISPPVSEETASSDGGSDFMFPRGRETCREFPQMCRRRPSPGPDCCGGKCTYVRKDRFNYGRCGCKCKHNKICCGGHCVNPSFDPHHCGSCAKHCKK